MTHYWWMHWFWITLFFSEHFCVIVGHSLLTTLHSNFSTTVLPPTNTTTQLEASKSEQSTLPIPPRTSSLEILRNISQYARNESFKPSVYSGKLEVIPLDVPTSDNASEWINNTNRDIPVINQNVTETNLGGNFTGFIFSRNKGIAPSNHTENGTFLGEDLSYNQSFVQKSERIGIEEGDLHTDDTTGNLSAAGITGITLACIVIVGIICGISFFVYRNQGFNRPQVLNDRCSNPDSSGYIDDASVRDNSEEMYSLDNDSFLNSLEAMTIQNYWTDTVKHTKL
ncbi:uncharacterized protein [Euwallacea fornicatus]|uniref:uncharacterized protein isoform X1 n=1 Tax=Euwallacea fornicatus TaxID=995702 RepID=UPI00338E5C88